MHAKLNPLFLLVTDNALDGDNPEHIQWVFEKAQQRAAQFNITGVTYRLTQGEKKLTLWSGHYSGTQVISMDLGPM